MTRYLLIALTLLSFSSFSQTDTLTIVAYNVLNFPDGRDDCGTNTVVPNRADTLGKLLSFMQPDIFVACEIQTEAGADSILTRSLNINGATNFQSAQWHPNGNGGDLNNQMYYNTDKLTFYSQYAIATSSRDIDHYVLYVNDPTLNVYFDTTFIDVYMSHLKAGQGGSNATTRAAQTQVLMDYIATQPSDHHHVFCGDLNVYTSSEDGYQNLITGPFALVDPINTPGSWNNSSSYADVHTQSTRTSLNLDCGSKGGSDDRFDQILVSANVMDGSDSVKYLSNSYRAIGNDGNHFNTNLLDGPNSQYPADVVKSLFYMSDHLPVSMDLVVTYPTSNGLALYPLIQNVTCAGDADGEATIVANQGQSPYTYQWDAAAGNATSATVSGLQEGQYCVQVTDFLGQVDNYCVYVAGPQPLSYSSFSSADTDNCNGAIHVIAAGGSQPYSYQWNDSQNQTTASATDLCGGTYELIITDAEGCEITAEITIQTVSLAELWIDNVTIAPNPTSQVLNVSSEALLNRLQVVDLSGRTVIRKSVQSEQVAVNVSQLQSGSYFLLFQSEAYPNNIGRVRFVKR